MAYANLDRQYAKTDHIATDRMLYSLRDLSHPYGEYKLGETIELNQRSLEGTQTLQPRTDAFVTHSRVFHNATKADIVAQENKGFEMLKLMGSPRIKHVKSGRDSEFVIRTTAEKMACVIYKLADWWNGTTPE